MRTADFADQILEDVIARRRAAPGLSIAQAVTDSLAEAKAVRVELAKRPEFAPAPGLEVRGAQL
jgi:hypothetical protein